MRKLFKSRALCFLIMLGVILSTNAMFSIQTSAASGNINVVYQTYDHVNKKWLPNVTNTQDYAGVFGHAVDCVYANLSQGNITYNVHVKGGSWLPAVKNRSDYAGIKGKAIDGLMIKTDTGRTIKYRVHLKGGNWLPYVTGYNQYDGNNGYAGAFGREIDAIQMYVASDVSGKFTCAPAKGYTDKKGGSGFYGWRTSPTSGKQEFHTGIDIGSNSTLDIKSVGDGVVIASEYNGGYGNMIKIKHTNGLQTWYAHCSKLKVAKGDKVSAGQVIATMGKTGNATGVHLHFEVRDANNNHLEPLNYIPYSGTLGYSVTY